MEALDAVLHRAVHRMMELRAVKASAVVDLETGKCLASHIAVAVENAGSEGGESAIKLPLAASVMADILRTQFQLVRLQYPVERPITPETIDDLLIVLSHYFQLARPIRMVSDNRNPSRLFLFAVLERESANLVSARRCLTQVEQDIREHPEAIEALEGIDGMEQLQQSLQPSSQQAFAVARVPEQELLPEDIPIAAPLLTADTTDAADTIPVKIVTDTDSGSSEQNEREVIPTATDTTHVEDMRPFLREDIVLKLLGLFAGKREDSLA